jgi:multiple sugar transport system substrate-binding protein
MAPSHRRALSRRSYLKLGLASIGLAAVPLLQSCAAAPATPTTAPAQPTTAAKPTTAPAAATPAAAATTAPAATGATPAAKGAAVKPGTKIQISSRGGTDGELLTKSAEDFAKATGIQAEHVSYGAEPEYWAKVQALHSTKQVADVIWASVGNFHNFANRGLLAELDPLIKADSYDLSDYLENGLKSLSWKGKLYGMPWGGHPGDAGLLYNVDLLNKAGLNVTEDQESMFDWTYDTLMDAARKTTVESGGKVTQFGYLPVTGYLSLINVIGAYGGEFMTPDGTKLNMDTDEFKKGIGWVRDAFTTYKVAPTPGPDLNAAELFATGKLAMMQGGYGNQFSPGDKGIAGRFKWGLTVQPKGPTGNRGTRLTINGQTISSVSQNQDAAWQFVKYLMEPANHIPVVLAGGSRPALRKSVLESAELNEKMESHKVWVKVLNVAEPWRTPANLRWPEFNSTIQQVFAGVWAGTQTLEQAMPEAKKKLQDILDKPMI